MNKLEYEIDGERHELQLPTSLAEMTGEQLVAAVRLMNGDDGDPLRIVCGMPEDAFAALSDFQRFMIMDSFGWLNHLDMSSLSFKGWKIPSIDVDGEVWYGPTSNFGNITWGEFVYADQCMIQGFHRAAVAALFRPQRKDYDGETDRRVPFTIYGADTRMRLMNLLSDDQLEAFVLCYTSLRKRFLEQRYPNVFARAPKRPKTSPNDKPPAFSGVAVHRDLMGDRFYDESKFFASNVHVILGRLDKVIREGGRK